MGSRPLSNAMTAFALTAFSLFSAAPLQAQDNAGGGVFATAHSEPQGVDQSEPATAVTPCPGGTASTTEGWRLAKASLGVTIVSATNSQQTYQGEVLSLRDVHPGVCGRPRQRSLANLIFNYDSRQSSTRPGSAVNRTADVRLQHLFFVRDNTRYLAVNADSFHNSSIGVYFQQALGLGVGKFAGKTVIDADLRVIHQRFYHRESDRLFGSQFSVRRSFAFKNSSVLTATIQAVPVFNDSDAWQARGTVGVVAPLADTFALSATAFETYVNNAPDKYKKNYFKLVLGVQFTPGQ